MLRSRRARARLRIVVTYTLAFFCGVAISHSLGEVVSMNSDVNSAIPAVSERGARTRVLQYQEETPHHTIGHLVEAFLQSELPQKNSNISSVHPFFFFHQAKTGGSSMRQNLHKAAVQSNLSSFIPCYDGVQCEVFTLGYTRKDLFAGHFTHDEAKNLLYLDSQNHLTKRNFSCVTQFRNPIKRVESCYYYRYIQAKADAHVANFTCINDVPNDILIPILTKGVGGIAGCLHEPFRVFSDCETHSCFERIISAESTLYLELMKTALENIAECVILILEDDKTTEAAKQWFPQLEKAFTFKTRENERTVGNCELSSEKLSLLQALTEGEMLLYNAAQQRARRFREVFSIA